MTARFGTTTAHKCERHDTRRDTRRVRCFLPVPHATGVTAIRSGPGDRFVSCYLGDEGAEVS